LPPKPQIFHGRDEELKTMIALLSGELPRISILGPGGIGKTSLAISSLHHASVVAKFEHRLFIASESASTDVELAKLIASQLQLPPVRDVIQQVVRYFLGVHSALLVLDNLETSWEPATTRRKVEEFLALL
ncbi:hypothetical protein C8R43DRAFT_824684, partial [Mycena crocata]